MTNEPANQPKVITKSDPTRLVIEWRDGAVTQWSARELRDLCPCARCVDETTGRPIHDPRSTLPDIVTSHVTLVGLYALSIGFSDGHATGIYPFVFLRQRAGAGRATR